METSKEIDLENKDLAGVGGWLILPAIGTFLWPVLLANALFDSFSLLRQAARQVPDIAIFDVATLSLLFGISLWAIYLFLKRDKRYPAVFSILLGLNLVIVILGAILLTSHGLSSRSLIPGLFRAAISSGIWIPYMRYSKRVKNTFVN